jgi:aspartate-semialdehyde dehydrogenase
MVGSVLMQRMAAERDLDHVDPVFFSTSQAGGAAPVIGGRQAGPLRDANDVAALAQCDVVVTCQGATTPTTCTPGCVPRAGRVTGSTPRRRCA